MEHPVNHNKLDFEIQSNEYKTTESLTIDKYQHRCLVKSTIDVVAVTGFDIDKSIIERLTSTK